MDIKTTRYRNLLKQLLPPGKAYEFEEGSHFDKLLTVLAQLYARFDDRAQDVLREMTPLSSIECLPEWEDLAGIRDMSPSTSIDVRRQNIQRLLWSRGEKTNSFFMGLAQFFGYTIDRIEECKPCVSGFKSGALLYGSSWAFCLRIYTRSTHYYRFHSGSFAGEFLSEWRNQEFEETMRNFCPAHIGLIFSYT